MPFKFSLVLIICVSGVYGESWDATYDFKTQDPLCPRNVVDDDFHDLGNCGTSPKNPCLINIKNLDTNNCDTVYQVTLEVKEGYCNDSDLCDSTDDQYFNIHMYVMPYADVTSDSTYQLSGNAIHRMVRAICSHYCNYIVISITDDTAVGHRSGYCLRFVTRSKTCVANIASGPPTPVTGRTNVGVMLNHDISPIISVAAGGSNKISVNSASMQLLPSNDIGQRSCTSAADWPSDLLSTCGSTDDPCEVFIVSENYPKPLNCSCIHDMYVTIPTGLAKNEYEKRKIKIRFRDVVSNLTEVNLAYLRDDEYDGSTGFPDDTRKVVPGLLLDHRFFLHMQCDYYCSCIRTDPLCKLIDGSYFLCSQVPCNQHDTLFESSYSGLDLSEAGDLRHCQYSHHWDLIVESDDTSKICPPKLTELSQFAFATEIESPYPCESYLITQPTVNGVTHKEEGLCRGKVTFSESLLDCGDDVENACPMNYRFLSSDNTEFCEHCFAFSVELNTRNPLDHGDSSVDPGEVVEGKFFVKPWNAIEVEEQTDVGQGAVVDFNQLYQVDETHFFRWIKRHCANTCLEEREVESAGFCRQHVANFCNFNPDIEITLQNYQFFLGRFSTISKVECDGGPCRPNPCTNKQLRQPVAYEDDSCSVDLNNKYSCNCAEQFEWHSNEFECTAVDYCKHNKCEELHNDSQVVGAYASGDCIKYIGTFACDCGIGFSWNAESEECETDQCSPNPCGDIPNTSENSACTKRDSTDYICECASNYYWDGDNNLCKINPCVPNVCEENHRRNPEAYKNAECETVNDGFRCICNESYMWSDDNCVYDPCADSPCLAIPHGNHCHSWMMTSFVCDCDESHVWIHQEGLCKARILSPNHETTEELRLSLEGIGDDAIKFI